MTDFLTNNWIDQLKRYQHLLLGFSGGLDSAVLLHVLKSHPDLAPKLIAVHINHQLQPQSDDWQDQCFELCQRGQIRFIAEKIAVNAESNIEAAARQARYDVFTQLVGADDALVTAHHADDQVETFFLNLFRGAGMAGMACMPDSQPFARGMLLRPFLKISKQSLLGYARLHQLGWIDDPSNLDCRFQRNWLRNQWVPLLKQRWPKAPDNILRSIGLLQQTYQAEQSNTSLLLRNCLETANRLAIAPLLRLTKIEQNNVIRNWLKQHHLTMPTKKQLENLFQSVVEAKQDANPAWRVGNISIRRYQGRLYLLNQCDELITSIQPVLWTNFSEPLWLSGRKQYLRVSLIGDLPDYKQVEVRFRQGGERFRWRGKTRALKKLLQDWNIPPWQRDRLPLLFIDQELVAVADHAVCDSWQTVMLSLIVL